MGTTAADSLIPYFWLTEAIKKDNYETKYIALGGVSTSERLTEVHFKFTSTGTLNVVYARSMNYGTIIIKKIYGIKLNTANGTASTNNPIGAIVPIMGTQAPKDHLICDGSELNINEYKELADYFEAQFGSKNYFGGDGTTTFAVPDLRNEFLRGYGDRTEEVGIHQDATEIPNVYTNAKNNNLDIYLNTDNSNSFVNSDTNLTTPTSGTGMWSEFSKYDMASPCIYRYTTRPTNVAVLFCIKYTESGSANGTKPAETVLFEGKGLPNTNITSPDALTNYDIIKIEGEFLNTKTGEISSFFTGEIPKYILDERLSTTNGFGHNFSDVRNMTTWASLRIYLWENKISVGTLQQCSSGTYGAQLRRVVGIKY